jgi:hypothetical protein
MLTRTTRSTRLRDVTAAVSDVAHSKLPCTVRIASLDDAKGILTLLEEAAPEIPVSLDDPPQQRMIQIITGECLLGGKSWVAVDAACNVIGAALIRETPRDHKIHELHYVAVSKTSRNKGVFSSLIDKSKSRAAPLTAAVLHGNKSGMIDHLTKRGFVKGDVGATETKLRWDPAKQSAFV